LIDLRTTQIEIGSEYWIWIWCCAFGWNGSRCCYRYRIGFLVLGLLWMWGCICINDDAASLLA
jgi:hypothetical protein